MYLEIWKTKYEKVTGNRLHTVDILRYISLPLCELQMKLQYCSRNYSIPTLHKGSGPSTSR